MTLDQFMPVKPQCVECGSDEMDSVHNSDLCWKCKMVKQKKEWAKYESSTTCDNCKKESVVNSDFVCRACVESGYYVGVNTTRKQKGTKGQGNK